MIRATTASSSTQQHNRNALEFISFFFITLLFVLPLQAKADSNENFYHWWVSSSESSAFQIILTEARLRGAKINDIGLKNHQTLRKTLNEVLSLGFAPLGTQWLGSQDLIDLTQLTDIIIEEDSEGGSASSSGLATQIDDVVKEHVMYEGDLIAVPVVNHLQNIMIVNRRLHDENNLQVPRSWQEFLLNMEKFKQQGKLGVIVSDQAWQLRKLFVSIVIGLGGAEGYRSLYGEVPSKSNSQQLFEKAFDIFLQIRQSQDERSVDLDWHRAAQMLADGEVAVLFQGDYAHAEAYTHLQGRVNDIDCLAPPGDQNTVEYAIDQFVFFRHGSEQKRRTQQILAETILDPDIQRKFTAIKGGIPVIKYTNADRLDPCSRSGYQRWNNPKRTLLLTAWANHVELMLQFQNYLRDVWQDSTVTAASAAAQLRALISKAL